MREGPPPKRIPLVDDVLDWLSDKGGYTGFTEEQLRSGEDLREVDMESFGEGTKVDNATTDAFESFRKQSWAAGFSGSATALFTGYY